MEIVELRVHGVHGTSPGTMLGVSDGEAGQVAGDRLTGLYRVRNGELPYRRLAETEISVEAYSWGALTSGVQGFFGWIKRALWLLLLPFALANLAYWARLEIGKANGGDRWGSRAIRAASVLLTVFMVLSPCVIAIDMVGWQCYRYDVPGCTHVPGQLDFLASLTAGQRLAVTSLVPMLVIGLLWLLSRKTLIRYEDAKFPASSPGTEAPEMMGGRIPILRNPDLWSGKERTERLQRLHLAAGIATVCAFSGLHVLVEEGGGALLAVTTVVACAVLLTALALSTVSHPRDLDRPPPGTADQPRSRLEEAMRVNAGWLTLTALVVFVLHLAALVWDGGDPDQSVDFFGHNVWFIAVFVLLAALTLAVFVADRMPTWAAITVVVVLVVGTVVAAELHREDRLEGWVLALVIAVSLIFVLALDVWHYRVADHDSHAWRGAGAAVMLAAGAWVALLFTTCAVIASADYLNGPDHSVADLVSQTPATNPTYENNYLASGDVTIRDANVVVLDRARGGPGIAVVSGTVTVDDLALRVTDEAGDRGYSVGRGTTAIDERATLQLPEASVSFEDSCIVTVSQTGQLKNSDLLSRCTAERSSFRAGGVLDVAAKTLLIVPQAEGDQDKVVLASANPPQQPLVVPQVLIWTPIGQLLWLLLVLGALIACVVRYWRTAGRRIAEFLPDEGGEVEPDNQIPRRDRPACRGKRRFAGLAHRAERLLDVIGVLTIPVGMLITVLSFTGKAPWELFEWLRPFATISMYAVFGMSLALIALGSQLRRSEGTRKAIGVIWDLTTFWPRAAHPLAPPCYAERVVPELQIRTQWALTADPDNRVVISGHSQGSLIVAAMASRLADTDLGRIRMVTYGSQIRALYGRIFPGVFGARYVGYARTDGITRLGDAFPDVPSQDPDRTVPGPPIAQQGSLRQRLEDHGGAWVNLFRRTDPLGYRVFSDVDSDLDLPVVEVPPRLRGDPGPQVMTHSGYQHSLVYRRVLAGWTNEILVPEPPGTQDLTILPPI